MSDLLLTEEAAPQPARRGFLRTLITAPVAALATHRLILPGPVPLVAPEDAAARLERHVQGVEAAMRDLFPGAQIAIRGNCLDGHHDYLAEKFLRGESGTACAVVMASLPSIKDYAHRAVLDPRLKT